LDEVVPDRLSLPITLRSLVGEGSFIRLRTELAKAEAHRVEIFCKEPWRVAERLTTACRELGVKLVIDSAAQQGQKARTRQPYLLFSDSFTADEWAVFFHNLGYADRRAEEKKAGEGIFDQLVIAAQTPTDQKELLAHVGIDFSPTATHSSSEKPDDAKAKAKPIVRQALLIPYHPQRIAPAGTKEIKQFLDARQDRRPGQVAVLLVIKPT